MMTLTKSQANPVFLVPLTDQYGNPVTGVTAPTVRLSKGQAADADTVPWVEGSDFTWHELTAGDSHKGWYKLRQVDTPTTSAVDVSGVCLLSAYRTNFDTAAGAVLYRVEDRTAYGPWASALADAIWEASIAEHATAGSCGEELHVAKAMLANQRIHTVSTGVDVVLDNDGSTPLRQMTPTDGGDDIIVTPS